MTVVGLGLMGASFALALGRAHPELELRGIDQDPRTVGRATEVGAVSVASPELELMAGSDLIMIAIPLTGMRSLLHEMAVWVGSAVVSDMASTKASVTAWAVEAGIDLVGGHPMCGSERSGFDAADPTLFRRAPWLLTRHDPTVEWAVRAVGAEPRLVDPLHHDRLVAGVSHAAFMVSTAYVLAMARCDAWSDMRAVDAGVFRDMSRLAGGDAEVYLGITGTNATEIAIQLEAVEREIAGLRRRLESGDPALADLFAEAREVRRSWEREQEARR